LQKLVLEGGGPEGGKENDKRLQQRRAGVGKGLRARQMADKRNERGRSPATCEEREKRHSKKNNAEL
jgi:hypothetical protein